MKTTYDERIELIELIESGVPKSQACKIIGVSRPTADKWLKRFYDDGLEGLLNRKSKPHSTPTKLSESDRKCILAISDKYPHLGAGSLCNKLQEENISVSPPTVQKILIGEGRAWQWDRFKIVADIFQHNPSSLPVETIRSMENISKYFEYRNYFTDKPGKKVFTWTEYCTIRGSSKKLPFFMFLDMNGLFLSIFHPSNILNRKPRNRLAKYYAEKIGTLPFTDSTIRINSSIYHPNGIPITELFVALPNKTTSVISDDILDNMNIKVRSIEKKEFNKIPFVKDTRSYFKRYLKIPIYDMIYYENPLKTSIKIFEYTADFLSHYNATNHITEYPLMGKTPLEFLADDWYLDIIDEIIKLIEQPLAKKKDILKRLEIIKRNKY